jgi:hypothetical protein
MVWVEANDDYRRTRCSGIMKTRATYSVILRRNSLGRFNCRCNCCSSSFSLVTKKHLGRYYQHPRFPRSAYARIFERLLSVCFAVHRHYITASCTFLLTTLLHPHPSATSSTRVFFYMSSAFRHYISTVTHPPSTKNWFASS